MPAPFPGDTDVCRPGGRSYQAAAAASIALLAWRHAAHIDGGVLDGAIRVRVREGLLEFVHGRAASRLEGDALFTELDPGTEEELSAQLDQAADLWDALRARAAGE